MSLFFEMTFLQIAKGFKKSQKLLHDVSTAKMKMIVYFMFGENKRSLLPFRPVTTHATLKRAAQDREPKRGEKLLQLLSGKKLQKGSTSWHNNRPNDLFFGVAIQTTQEQRQNRKQVTSTFETESGSDGCTRKNNTKPHFLIPGKKWYFQLSLLTLSRQFFDISFEFTYTGGSHLIWTYNIHQAKFFRIK